jgi:hypothetical protein
MRKQQGEFVAADSRDQVRFAQSLRDRRRDLLRGCAAEFAAAAASEYLSTTPFGRGSRADSTLAGRLARA